jgi:recombination protein RecA
VKKKLKSFAEHLKAKLVAGQPKSDGPTYEVADTSEEILSEIKYVVTTGLPPFDELTGGWPFGRVCELYGLEECGKTAMCLRSAIRAQMLQICEITRENGQRVYKPVDPATCEINVVYIDNEQSIDNDAKLIVDGQRANFIVCRTDTVDLMFKVVDQVTATAKERMEELAEAGIDKKVFTVIIVDTITSTSSRQELEQEWGKEDYARQPQQLSAGFRQMVRDINRYNVCMICTNQTRDNFKAQAQRGPRSSTPVETEYTTFGGKALRFYSSHRVFMWKSEMKYRLVPGAKFTAGYLVGFRTIKNRMMKPKREGRLVIIFDEERGGLHPEFSILETLIFLGFAEIVNKEKQTNFVFKFKSNKIETTTFGRKAASLEEQDEEPRGKAVRGPKDPSIMTRAEWPRFYAEHREDFDKLWAAAMTYAHATEGYDGEPAVVLDDAELEDETTKED